MIRGVLRARLLAVGLVAASLGLSESAARASDDPGARTATTAIEPAAQRTVQGRVFTKAERLHLRLGFAYLAREDFWISPGLTGEVGYQLSERFGVEVSSTLFASTLDAAARDLRVETGLLPDAQQPILRLVTGPRWAFAYGKMLIEGTDLVLHLDASLLLRVGALVTDQAVNFGADLALAVQVGFGERWLAWGEIAGFVGLEERAGWVIAGGPLGSLGLGLQL